MNRTRHHWTKRNPWRQASFLILTLAFLAGCWLVPHVRMIQDVTTAETVVLQATSTSPSHIELHVKGRIEGVATLTLLMAGNPYETEKLEGDIDFEWAGDWYDSEAVIEYRPEGVEGGRLKMIYRF
jgi:hypothetical protein